jgi:hypothetical protein
MVSSRISLNWGTNLMVKLQFNKLLLTTWAILNMTVNRLGYEEN